MTFNTDIDVDRVAFVGCDYYNSGMISGDLARVLMHHGGTAAAVMGNLRVRGHRERWQGFSDCLNGYPDIEVLGPFENQDDNVTCYRVVSQLLAERKVDLIYFGAAGLDGGVQAVVESGKDVQIISVDMTESVRRLLKNGTIAATVTQQPYMQGDMSVRILYDYLANKKKPKKPMCFTANEVKLRHNI